MKVGTETDLGHDYIEDYDLRVKMLKGIQYKLIGNQLMI